MSTRRKRKNGFIGGGIMGELILGDGLLKSIGYKGISEETKDKDFETETGQEGLILASEKMLRAIGSDNAEMFATGLKDFLDIQKGFMGNSSMMYEDLTEDVD